MIQNKTKNQEITGMMEFRKCLRKVKEVTFEKIVLYMYQPTDPASLGIIRFLFGE